MGKSRSSLAEMGKPRRQDSWDIERGLAPRFQHSKNLKAQVLEYLAEDPKDAVYHLRKLLQKLKEWLEPLKLKLPDVGELEKVIGETERKLKYSSGEDIVNDFVKELRDLIRRIDWTPSGSKNAYAECYDLVNALKDERRHNADLRQQTVDQQEQIADQQEQIAYLLSQKVDLQEQIAYLQSQKAASRQQNVDQQEQLVYLLSQNATLRLQKSTFRDRVVLRQLFQNFKDSRHDIDLHLMQEARKSFASEFPKESLDLRKSMKEKFPSLSWKSYIEIWNLMKLVRDLSFQEGFRDLMNMVRKDFPQGFSHEQLRVVVENTRISSKDAPLLGVYKMICHRFPEEPIQKKCVDLIISAHKVFLTDVLLEKFEALMLEAKRQFPTEFPEGFVSTTFTGTVSILAYRKSVVEDKEVLQAINRKLYCLSAVAKGFKWETYFRIERPEDFGEEFYNLCVCCAQWNIDVFHPNISGLERRDYFRRARNRELKAENEDVGLVVQEFLQLPGC